MTYQVLARKWRPRRFSDVVGQGHVIRTLTNAIEHDRMHHAYLFTGTRGVGKTSIARILAKALNCEALNGSDPCCECSVCLDVDAGRFVDLIEVDAASRTRVEDTRDLLDNVQYAPVRGGFKIYLIDEVHMLSGHSFNALLKTLEEPPPHVKFLLATTDPQKIPVTVLSRCLQLHLKRLLPQQIRMQMEKVLAAENLPCDEKALLALARCADGSMRDGLSLLDQAIVQGSGRVETDLVLSMLGIVAESPLVDLLVKLADGEAKGVLDCVDRLADLTQEFAEVLQQLLGLIHQIALAQAVPESIPPEEFSDDLAALVQRIPAADLQLYYQIGLLGQRDLELAPDSRSGFEMTLLRMIAFRPAQLSTGGQSSPRAEVESAAPEPDKDAGKQPGKVVDGESIGKQAAVSQIMETSTDWRNTIEAMDLRGMAKELARNSVFQGAADSRFTLALNPGHEQLRSKSAEERLEKALQQHFQQPWSLVIEMGNAGIPTPAAILESESNDRQAAAEKAIEQDANVRALKEAFEGEVIPGSTVPLDKQ